MDNIKALFMLYVNPPAAFSRLLDRGRLWLAIVAAFVVGYLLHWGDVFIPAPTSALARFISFAPGSYAAPLLLIAIVVAPAIILLRAISGFGSFSVMMQSDYATLLTCALMAWAAAYLPLALMRFAGFDPAPWLYLVFNAYAAVLIVFAVRTVFGTGFAAAAGITVTAWCAGAAGAFVLDIVGGMLYFLMSPLVLVFLYFMFGSNLRSFGAVMRDRQHFQRQLEISTNNPHDADAHYQLGLVYQRRHRFSEAIARLNEALKIDPSMADAHMQLGAIARVQGRFDDAIAYLKTAAALDDRLAQNDIWRELGAAYFGAGRFEEAAAALGKYVSRREYDPEGLYWYGKTLAQLGQSADAREIFERAVESVRTMPSRRRAQVRIWGSRAKSEL